MVVAPPLLQAEKLVWSPPQGKFTLEVPSLSLHRGECLGIIGRSGCGKSTLLGLLSLALRPTRAAKLNMVGQQLLPAHPLMSRKMPYKYERLLTTLRAKHVGFIPQTGGLIPFLKARENIILALRVINNDTPHYDTVQRINRLADKLEITDCLDQFPAQLSVGQRQRVAIARALIHTPPILMADEPTAPLHPSQAAAVLNLLRDYAKEQNAGVITVSHDIAALKEAGFSLRSARIKDCYTIINGEEYTDKIYS